MFPKIPHPKHTVIRWPPERLAAIDFMDEASRQNTIYGLVEFDVSVSQDLIDIHEATTGEKLSFASFVIRCVAQAVDEQPEMAASRQKNRGLVVFDDVDISTFIERDFEGKKHPSLLYIRSANKKSFCDVHAEMRASQQAKVDPRQLTEQRTTGFLRMPRFVRKWMLRVMRYDPFAKKFATGLVGVSSIGMFAPKNRRGWMLPISPFTLMVGIGTIYQAPVVVDGTVVIREMLALTLCFDHDVIDGGPAARFTRRLGQLIEAGFELPGGPGEVPLSD